MSERARRRPATTGSHGTTTASPGRGVAAGDRDAEQHAADPAERGQQQRLGEELGADLARVAPSDRRSPISARRSSTEMTIVLATPTPPTSSATAPSPSSSAVNVASVAGSAASASDGRDTSTSSGASGLAVAAEHRRGRPHLRPSARM